MSISAGNYAGVAHYQVQWHPGTVIKVTPNFASVIPGADLSIQWLATNFLEFYYEQSVKENHHVDPAPVGRVGEQTQ